MIIIKILSERSLAPPRPAGRCIPRAVSSVLWSPPRPRGVAEERGAAAAGPGAARQLTYMLQETRRDVMLMVVSRCQ